MHIFACLSASASVRACMPTYTCASSWAPPLAETSQEQLRTAKKSNLTAQDLVSHWLGFHDQD